MNSRPLSNYIRQVSVAIWADAFARSKGSLVDSIYFDDKHRGQLGFRFALRKRMAGATLRNLEQTAYASITGSVLRERMINTSWGDPSQATPACCEDSAGRLHAEPSRPQEEPAAVGCSRRTSTLRSASRVPIIVADALNLSLRLRIPPSLTKGPRSGGIIIFCVFLGEINVSAPPS